MQKSEKIYYYKYNNENIYCKTFFYSKEWNNINKEKTYLVFELDKELLNISTNDTDEYFEEVD